MRPRVRAFIGLGSNLARPAAQVRGALRALAALPDSTLAGASSLYRTPPMGPPGQPDYVNAVAALDTTLEAEPLLDALQAIEQAHGRVRAGEHWGPRTLDLDLLLYGAAVIRSARLSVPHPGIAERIFVLEPLHEIAPDLIVPGMGPVARLRAARGADPIERLDDGR